MSGGLPLPPPPYDFMARARKILPLSFTVFYKLPRLCIHFAEKWTCLLNRLCSCITPNEIRNFLAFRWTFALWKKMFSVASVERTPAAVWDLFWPSHILVTTSSCVHSSRNPYPLPKRVLHRVRSTASSFNFQSLFFKVIQYLLTYSFSSSVTLTLPSVYPSIKCFRSNFLLKMRPKQLTFLRVIYVGCSSPPGLYAILLHFSHDRSHWSSSSLSSTTL